MPVQLILDYFGIDTQDALPVESSEAAIHKAQQHIRDYLLNQSSTALQRIRLSNEALYHRFNYLEGMADVLPTQNLIPRLLLAEKLNKPLPDWLSNQLIVSLNLLNTPEAETEVDDFETQLFSACHKDLISGADFYAFVQALNKQPPAFLALLTVESLKKRLLNRLSFDFKIPPETAETFISELLPHEDIQVFLTKLAFQQHLFQLRGVINRHALNIALPAQTLPTPLFALPLLPLPENEGHSLKEKFLLVLNSLSRKILAGEIPPSALTELLFVDWDSVWIELEHLIELFPS